MSDDFKLAPDFTLTGAQEAAADCLAQALSAGAGLVTLLGVTGSGKTATMAAIVERLRRPALVLVHNRTLAAQLYGALRRLLPDTAVGYFVSYYDYFRPEAYRVSSGTYVPKATEANEDVERLRHSATAALFTRRDVLVVATVSAIYPRSRPDVYRAGSVFLRTGTVYEREVLVQQLVDAGYRRVARAAGRGELRVMGDTVELGPSFSARAFRLRFFGDEIEAIDVLDGATRQTVGAIDHLAVFPATDHFVLRSELAAACDAIEEELERRCGELERQCRAAERERLETRTREDLRLLRTTGSCQGIENYARQLDGRGEGDVPYTLLDYFPEPPLVLVDESHKTLPQLRSMAAADRARKETLIEHGFRLPSALDNRPLTYEELAGRAHAIVCASATPGHFERERSAVVVEQIMRPTGVLDPIVEVRPSAGWYADLLAEVRTRATRDERVLVTALSKVAAERVSRRLSADGVAARWLHADVGLVERMRLVRGLRAGDWDVLAGVDLLREGLDLPEVSLVAILDADGPGFLRGRTALIQTIGRATRHADGRVIMYAGSRSDSMREAIAETRRRRRLQADHNARHGVVPVTATPARLDVLADLALEP